MNNIKANCPKCKRCNTFKIPTSHIEKLARNNDFLQMTAVCGFPDCKHEFMIQMQIQIITSDSKRNPVNKSGL